MYYVYAVGRNYNIAISPQRAGTLARFRSRLENCNGGLFRVDCDIDITYNWSDETPGSGTNTITLTSGSNTVQETPSGYTLTSLEIVSISGPSCTYNDIGACIDSSVTTTTTTTTTTSTTTTTTTTTADSYPDPIIKHDQYSSSFGPGGNPIWPNIGSGGSTYDLGPSSGSSISVSGSGTGEYLNIKGKLISTGPVNEAAFYSTVSLIGDFASIYNKSFSYATIFRVPNTSNWTNISSFYAVDPNSRLITGFDLSFYPDIEVPGVYVMQPRFYVLDGDGPYAQIVIDRSKWYLGVLTFDKDASYSTALNFYLNLSKEALSYPTDWSPSTFFNQTQNWQTKHTLAYGDNRIDVAAVMFWENTVLTQAQVQNLANEYNSRYTLG